MIDINRNNFKFFIFKFFLCKYIDLRVISYFLNDMLKLCFNDNCLYIK